MPPRPTSASGWSTSPAPATRASSPTTAVTTFALIQGPHARSRSARGIEDEIEPALDKAAKSSGFTRAASRRTDSCRAGGDTDGPSVLAETLLGAAGALLVLLFVFASFLAFVPLMIAAVSILTTFLLVLGLTTFSDVSFVVQFLIALIGLGVAIDYSLLLVSRWREERAHGHDNEEAVDHRDEDGRPRRRSPPA